MLETVTFCPICGGNKFAHLRDCKDTLVSHDQFSIQECTTCHFVLTNPRPKRQNILKYYNSVSYISHANKSNSLINVVYRVVRNITIRKKLKMINTFSTRGKLLDYGCGTGHFISHVKSKGWNVKGIEPDNKARKIASTTVGEEDLHKTLTELSETKFNVVTLFHVLEHIHDLDDTLKTLVDLTTSQGVIFVAVPNHRSHDAKKYQSNWAGYDVPRHLYHFDSDSITQLGKKVGLKVVAQLPMHFDSYYVSLLSEKNLKSKFYGLRGLYSGLISNLKAHKTKEYSSLIYVLQKK